MKKIFTLVACALAAVSANAQVTFSPEGDALAIKPEAMSSNRALVVGINSMSSNPIIWDVENDDVQEYSDMATVQTPIYDEETWEIIGYEPVDMPCTGSFHAVSKTGIAVGELGVEGSGKAMMVDYANGGELKYLFNDEGESSSAYDITDDGTMIVGFHYLIGEDWSMIVSPCIWTNNGETRVDLPNPTEEMLGFRPEYSEARWVSADGSVIGGFVQSWDTGSWILQTWHRNAAGEYVADAPSAKYYEPFMGQGKPYMKFDVDASALSANGKWMPVVIQDEFDMNDWDTPWPDAQSARYDIDEDKLDILEGPAAQFFGIANNGTAVGRFQLDPWSPAGACIWPAGQSELVLLTDLYDDFSNLSSEIATALSSINAEGTHVCGSVEYITSEEGDDMGTWHQRAFIAELPGEVGIQNIENNAPKSTVIYDLSGRKLNDIPANAGMYIVNGKKYIKK